MYSILIVEDEVFALYGLRASVDWQAAGIDQVFEAANGKDAYDLYLREHPDIILTDLGMPVMDGLTLIRTIREGGDAKTRFVIMSCMDEFSMVQQALNMGVSHYFLKVTTSRKDIQAILGQITKELDSGQQKDHRDIGGAEKLMQHLDAGGALSLEEGEKLFSILELPPDQPYRLLLAKSPITPRGGGIQAAPQLGQKVAALSGGAAELLRLSSNCRAALLSGDQAEKLAVSLPQLGGGDECPLAGISRLRRGPEQLEKAMVEAKQALDICYFTGASSAVYDGRAGNTLPGQMVDRLLSLPKIFNHLPGKFVDDYENRIRQLSGQLYPDAGAFKKQLCNMAVWLSMETDCVMDALENVCMSYANQISGSETLLESVVFFEQFTTEMLSLSSFSRQMPDTITAALLYIHANLDHPLTLNEIADHTHLNPSYLSTLFHKVMRQSPISYVNSLRIERSRVLLRNTDLPISQIAASLGFSQEIYFYRLFKRLSQETPNEYRATYRAIKQPAAAEKACPSPSLL